MTKQKQLNELVALTEMVFAARSREVQKLSRQQVDLRENLADLRRQAEGVEAEFAQDIVLRMTRTDILWQIWVGRQKSALNAELARVSVEKERRMQGMRLAFGKKDAAARLAKDGRPRQTF